MQRKIANLNCWLGQWNVVTSRGAMPAGDSRIELILGDCVVQENWTSARQHWLLREELQHPGLNAGACAHPGVNSAGVRTTMARPGSWSTTSPTTGINRIPGKCILRASRGRERRYPLNRAPPSRKQIHPEQPH